MSDNSKPNTDTTQPVVFHDLELVTGTRGNDEWYDVSGTTAPGLEGTIYFGLQGEDYFKAGDDNYPLLVGGAGNDTYEISGVGTALIIESGDSPNDTLILPKISPDNFAIPIYFENSHLLYAELDTLTGEEKMAVFIADWLKPENRIESIIYDGSHFDFDAFKTEYVEAPRNFLIDNGVPADVLNVDINTWGDEEPAPVEEWEFWVHQLDVISDAEERLENLHPDSIDLGTDVIWDNATEVFSIRSLGSLCNTKKLLAPLFNVLPRAVTRSCANASHG